MKKKGRSNEREKIISHKNKENLTKKGWKRKKKEKEMENKNETLTETSRERKYCGKIKKMKERKKGKLNERKIN